MLCIANSWYNQHFSLQRISVNVQADQVMTKAGSADPIAVVEVYALDIFTPEKCPAFGKPLIEFFESNLGVQGNRWVWLTLIVSAIFLSDLGQITCEAKIACHNASPCTLQCGLLFLHSIILTSSIVLTFFFHLLLFRLNVIFHPIEPWQLGKKWSLPYVLLWSHSLFLFSNVYSAWAIRAFSLCRWKYATSSINFFQAWKMFTSGSMQFCCLLLFCFHQHVWHLLSFWLK